MRSLLGVGLIVGLLGGWSSPAAAGNDLAGVFEIASLGADRRVEVWKVGETFTAYRVLNPLFEGEIYKLEHLFIGKVKGGQIKGQLYVREEGMRSFEKLRSFVGSVESDQRMMLDGLPIDRQDEELTREPPSLKPKKRRASRPAKTSFALPGAAAARAQEVL